MERYSSKRRAQLLGMCCSIGRLILLTVWFVIPSHAQESTNKLVEIELSLDQSGIKVNEDCQALLVIRNNSAYPLTNISIRPVGTTFEVENLGNRVTTVSPYGSASLHYPIRGKLVGSLNVVFEMQYSWYDDKMDVTHHSTETVHAGSIEVLPRLNFNWPNYVIPLILGFGIGQVGSWLADRRKYHKEQLEQEEQVQHVTLSILKATLAGVKKKEEAPFKLWSEVVIKGHLSPALHRFCRRIDNTQLSQKLAELTIILEMYNRRQTNDTLKPDFVKGLTKNLINMIKEFEKTGRNPHIHRRLFLKNDS